MPDQTIVDKAVTALHAQPPTSDKALAKDRARAVLRTYGFDDSNSEVWDFAGQVKALLRTTPCDYGTIVVLGGGQ